MQGLVRLHRVWVFTGAALASGLSSFEMAMATEEEISVATELSAIEVVGRGSSSGDVESPLVS